MPVLTHPTRPAFLRWLPAGALIVAFAIPAQAQPTLGFTEDFPGTSTSTWQGGSIFANPGAGGFGGSVDGYLDLSTPSPAHLGTVSSGAEYVGDWTAAGVTQVSCWMRDIGGTGDLEIHLLITEGQNIQTWQQDAGFIPPSGVWGKYVVNLVESDFTRIRGTGTFAAAMAGMSKLHFRHDLAPYGATPDPVQGAFGLDHIQLGNDFSTGVRDGSLALRPVLLAPPYPNPAVGRVTFQIQQPESHPVSLDILDAAGRRVRHVEFTGLGAAPHLWMWDGSDDTGRAAPAGVYRVLARGVNGGMVRTVTLLR